LKALIGRIKDAGAKLRIWHIMMLDKIPKPPLAFWSRHKRFEIFAGLVEGRVRGCKECELPGGGRIERLSKSCY
jgi:hypothetical protein